MEAVGRLTEQQLVNLLVDCKDHAASALKPDAETKQKLAEKSPKRAEPSSHDGPNIDIACVG